METNLAKTIPRGLDNVFASQQGMGSLSDAQDVLTQALLAALANAFNVTTIVQAPATVHATGAASPGVTQPPMLSGAVGPITSGSPGAASPTDAQTPYTLTPGELDIESGTSSPWLTSLLTVAQPAMQEAWLCDQQADRRQRHIPEFPFTRAAVAGIALDPANTYTLNCLIQGLPKLPAIGALGPLGRGLLVAKVFRNKEGHAVLARHTFDPQNYRDIEQSLIAVYDRAFGQTLQVTFSVATNERAKWVLSRPKT